MNVASWFWASLIATTAWTLTLAASQQLGWTRMSFPLLLGTMWTPNRDRALALGLLSHGVAGFALGALYTGLFEWLRTATWWLGLLAGMAHGALVLLVLLPALPAVHPRMASETHGPDPTAGLEPPGALGLNYGRSTPLFTFVAHVAYGAALGALYRLDAVS